MLSRQANRREQTTVDNGLAKVLQLKIAGLN
jgi:hypothetical protein